MINAILGVVFRNGVTLDIEGTEAALNTILSEFYSHPEKEQPGSLNTGNGTIGHFDWRSSEVVAMLLVPK